MPTLATGISVSSAATGAAGVTRVAPRGFTLIELLVVLVIIGMVSAGVVLSLGSVDNDAQLNDERERLSALFDYARERGSLATTEYGLQVAQQAYQFCYFDSLTGKWQVELLDEQLRPRALAPGLRWLLDVEGRQVVLKAVLPDPTAHASEVPDYTPQIMLYSNGDTNDFALTLRRPDPEHLALQRQFTVRSKGGGEVEFGKTLSAGS